MGLLTFRFKTRALMPRVVTLSLLFLLLTSYQNCSPTSFGETQELQSKREYEAECPNGCEDSMINLQQDVQKPEVKVVIVVDNSFSMSQSQEKLARGVGSLIDGLRGFTAQYHVFTTTQEGEKAVAQVSEGCEVIRNGVRTLLAAKECPIGTSRLLGDIYSQFKKWSLLPSLTQGDQYRIAENGSDAEFKSLETRVADVIASPGTGIGVNGSDSERGICSMVRTLYDQGKNKIFNPNDAAVFAVISDENDHSDLTNCLSEQRDDVNCIEEDTTPRPRTDPIPCTDRSCSTMQVKYEVDLGARSALVETVSFQRQQKPYSQRVVSFKKKIPASYQEVLKFTYLVPQPDRDGVSQPARSVEAQLTRAVPQCLVAANNPCSADQTTAASGYSTTNLGTLKANSCSVASCSLKTAESVTTVTSGKITVPNCSAITEDTCKSYVTTDASYIGGSCATVSCQDITPAPIRVNYSSKEVTTARAPLACTAAEIAAIKASRSYVPLDYTFIENSCEVKDATVSYTAKTVPYTITHKMTDSIAQVQAESYCGSRLYLNNRTLSNYAVLNNNNRPFVACRIASIGDVVRTPLPPTGTVPPPPGTPKCVAQAQKRVSFPQDSKEYMPSDISAAFSHKAAQMFGSNYFVSAIVHTRTDDPACPILDGQSVGTAYQDLTTKGSALQGQISSICSADYGPAFSGVSQWVKKSLINTYVLNQYHPGDQITRVWLVRAGEMIPLTLDDVEVRDGTIKFLHTDIFQEGDEIHYRLRKGDPTAP